MLYTRTGDSGTSGLFGTKKRFPKDSPLYDALGTLDELNSLLGLCRSRVRRCADEELDIPKEIIQAQETLFVIQAEIAGADKHVSQSAIGSLERTIAAIEDTIEAPHAFVIPGATESSALFDYARAVCRRAERTVVGARSTEAQWPLPCMYLNRLSSLLYALARYAAARKGVQELSPTY